MLTIPLALVAATGLLPELSHVSLWAHLPTALLIALATMLADAILSPAQPKLDHPGQN